MSGLSSGEHRALVALYHRCGGKDWERSHGWLSDPDPCAWEGVTCEAGRVTRLALPDNRLQGTLPAEVALLAYLEQIDLSGNALSGAIPTELGSLLRLAVIDLSDNDLSGPLPERLRILRRLRHLDLHGNRLNGQIPPALRDLAALETLDLSQNRFTGPVPPQLGKLTRLVTLRLDRNDLRGPLPMELTALRSLSAFSFDQTGLLELPDPDFQAWLSRIDRLRRTGVLHAEVVERVAGEGNLPLAALAGMGAFGGVLVATLVALLPVLGPAAAVFAAVAGVAGGGLAGRRVYRLTAERREASPSLAAFRRSPDTTPEDSALREDLTQELRRLVHTTRADLPSDIVREVEAIETTLLGLMPRIPRINSGDADVYTVRQMIRDYLPEALTAYRALPRDVATQRPIQAGKTAHDHLLEQLHVLHQGLRDIEERLPQEGAQRLLVHGRFLSSKFTDERQRRDR
jgi:hypothetical protein